MFSCPRKEGSQIMNWQIMFIHSRLQTPHRDRALSEAELLSGKTLPTGERPTAVPLHLNLVS